MTELFHDARRDEPAMHALVIGVGSYPYLPGGPLADPREAFTFDGMRQLTSPPRSALAFARLLVDGGTARWNVPAGSVDLLISSPDGDVPPGLPEPAPREPTIDRIREAFAAWLARCATHPENVAVLYFCGHGLQAESQLLLAGDFNRFGATPFAQAFDFDETRLALQQRGPRTQCLIIDACRTDCFDLRPGPVAPLARPEVFAPRVCTHELTLRLPAFEETGGRRGEVSQLTRAVIRALDGEAATTDDAGRWVVRMEGVRRSVDTLLREELDVSSLPRGVESNSLGDTVLRRLDEAPAASLTVRCHPAGPAARTRLSCAPHHPEDLPPVDCGEPRQAAATADLPAGQEWRMRVRAGVYLLRAKSPAAEVSRPHSVLPPHSRASMEVAR